MPCFLAYRPPLPTDPTVQSLSELALRWCSSTVTGVSALAALKTGPTPHTAATTSLHCRSFSCSGKTHYRLADRPIYSCRSQIVRLIIEVSDGYVQILRVMYKNQNQIFNSI
jgi:hypothetical protein